MIQIASVNVNGVRAAARKDMGSWVLETKPDVLCLQEVRAPRADLVELSTTGPLAADKPWEIYDDEASAKGRAGVAVLSRHKVLATSTNLGPADFDSAGRWLEAEIDFSGTTVTVISCYVHSGEADTPKQVEKYKFLDAMTLRMQELIDSGKHAVVVGDLNVGHTELDIKNWKGNLKNAGFLPEERAYFDGFQTMGWVDMGRVAHPGTPGPTPGGPIEARPSTMTPVGELIISWPPQNLPNSGRIIELIERQAMTPVGATTLQW